MATNTAPSFTAHNAPGSGSTAGPYSITFTYIDENEIDVTVNGTLQTKGLHYIFASATTIQFTSGNNPPNSASIKFQRDTNIGTKKVDFQDGSVLTETDLDSSTDQLLFGLQELADDYVKRNGSQSLTGNLIFEGSTDDNNETTLAVTDPTADRTITLPDRSGTVITSGDTGTVTSTMIEDGTIVNADVNASAAIAGTKISPDFGSQNIATSGTVDGRDVSVDGSKLDGIETGATADQTAAEIRTLVDNATDSNVFTDADHTKLNGIETGATADQTAAEIRTLVDAATDSNVFTDSFQTKLNNIEANATADQTNDEIRDAVEAASNSNTFTDADHSKLNGIEAAADVTDTANVDAAGAIMNTDLDTKGEILVGDGAGDPTALSVGQNNYVLIADSNEATGIKWGPAPTSGGLNNIVEDTSPQLGGDLDVQTNEITSGTTNANIVVQPNGTGVFEVKGDGTTSGQSGTVQLNCSFNTHGVKIKAPAHSAGANYTLTLPSNVVNGQFLKTDTNGNLSWGTTDLTALNASNLTSGTIPDARFPATLPAASAANLTNIPAGNLTGTVADARISSLTASKLTGALPAISGANLTALPATLPAASAANLTSIPAANITGTLPAIDGSNLTGITAGAQGGGGESIFFESENSMDNDYTITANHNALVAGPLTINATLTINSPSVLTVP